MNLETLPFQLLSLAAGISGLLLAWKTWWKQARDTSFDDQQKLIETYRVENDRLRADLDRLEDKLVMANKRILEARSAAAVWQQRLTEERKIYGERVDTLEQTLKEERSK